MAGYYTPGLPKVGTSSGITGGANYLGMTGYEAFGADTPQSGGVNPETVLVTAFQIASIASAVDSNTATESAGAATLNTNLGTITSAAQTTAVGGTYTLTLTNSTVTATSAVQAMVYNGTNTGGLPQITRITPAAGSVVIVVTNNGTTIFNGTLKIPFQTR